MDMKILAAVFVTLALVFAGMNTETIEGVGMSGIGEIFSGQPPETNTGVEAQIKLDRENTTVEVAGDLTVKGLKEYLKGDTNVKSESDIKFKKFRGKIFVADTSKVTGRAAGFVSNGVKVDQSLKLEKETNTSLITIENMKRTPLRFERADIQLEELEGSSSISETNTTVNIKSFSGNMTISPQEMTIDLRGNISVVEAGPTRFGGN